MRFRILTQISKIATIGIFTFLLCGATQSNEKLGDETFESRQNLGNLSDDFCSQASPESEGRVVCADIAAIDQTLIYNRFGSFNPFGMMFALKRDLVPMEEDIPPTVDASACNARLGTEIDADTQALLAGEVRLKDCKRPRPITLRANVGDTIIVRVSNLLINRSNSSDPSAALPPDFTADVCPEQRFDELNLSTGTPSLLEHQEVSCRNGNSTNATRDLPSDWPATRLVNLVVQGLHPLPVQDGEDVDPACLGTGAVVPNEEFVCKFRVDEEGTYFFASTAAPAGGEGDGGSLVHGLFGAVIGERAGSTWYRSQLPKAAFDMVWPKNENKPNPHARNGLLNYEKTDPKGTPIVNMAKALDTPQSDFANAKRIEIVHSDLNAIIYCDAGAPLRDCRPNTTEDESGAVSKTVEPGYRSFREFSVFFHDELKTFYGKNFEELGKFGQLAGVKDGFAINYGASGMGSLLLANRKGIGPSAECMECLYEEFFLTSWANGDPALLEQYADDPSNVHHSYLNDPVVFRNFHAGPKETHVFHLHAQQWFAGNDPGRGSYLDSQTVAPQQGFTYNIYHGGLSGKNGAAQDGWWDTHGSGNRNRTMGDSIFHCHLYPHFAQGMWALWRVHDVLEDGSRKLPDGQGFEGLSTQVVTEFVGKKRLGSVNLQTGEWNEDAQGTPIPAIVPLPEEPLPLLPTYADDTNQFAAMPGYPFTLAGEVGHRPPQAPLDIARKLEGSNNDAKIDDRIYTGEWLDGGIGRHVVLDGSTRSPGVKLPQDIQNMLSGPNPLEGQKRVDLLSQIVAKSFAFGDLTAHLDTINTRTLDNAGTTLERAAMGFHYNGRVFDPDDPAGGISIKLEDAAGNAVSFQDGGYISFKAGHKTDDTASEPAESGKFYVNSAAPKPGAPFADPCGTASFSGTSPNGIDPLYPEAGLNFNADPYLLGFRRYEASAVQLDMVVNQAGWHDPQARINVLTSDSGRFKETATSKDRISPLISDSEEPFFFRALSGECIEFRHTNELPKELALDDFQVKTPTDTIGQHIHLVKFDVTASDGSGNGWNYEDGTFAPDELLARRCAARNGTVEGDGELRPATDDECKMKDIWRLDLEDNRAMFQTTVQRWFADPILTLDETGLYRDRTLKTVFTHDHFGPSSIQQHGFYNALVLEPWADFNDDGTPVRRLQAIKDVLGDEGLEPLNFADAKTKVSRGVDVLTGTQKLVRFFNQDGQVDDPDYINRDFREFALTIADFALLYDPRGQKTKDEFRAEQFGLGAANARSSKGMERLYCELLWRRSPYHLGDKCGLEPQRENSNLSWYFPAANLPPAWLSVGTPSDRAHRNRWFGDIVQEVGLSVDTNEVYALREYIYAYREKAAGRYGDGVLAKPVAPPMRPESISVDHHDPYLVNYRNAPIPVRIADKDGGSVRNDDCLPLEMRKIGDTLGPDSEVITALKNGDFSECSYSYQLEGEAGDMASVLRSDVHGDPETPVLEALHNERIVFRLIQGAQEVQHTFILSGQPHKRNINQAFSSGMQPLGTSATKQAQRTRMDACFEQAGIGRPSEYYLWLDNGAEATSAPAYFEDYEEILAHCDNVEGFIYAQEIGISEHFETQGSLRADISASIESASFEFAGVDETAQAALSSDYLYHFGSVDALWNGAWGLLRVTTPELNTQTESVAPVDITANLSGGASCPLPKEGKPLKVVEAVIVAAEVRDIFETDGTSYGGTLYDPDGLFLGLLKPSQLVEHGFHYEKTVSDPSQRDALQTAKAANEAEWQNLNPALVRAALKANYVDGPTPMVLRVNAGDCVRLRYVNLLTGENGRLADRLGDATLPPITPLNVDPASVVHWESVGNTSQRKGKVAIDEALVASGVAPSAALALQIGLPGLDAIQDVPHAYGNNQTKALPPASATTAPATALFEFYAGRARLSKDADMSNPDFEASIASDFFARLGNSPTFGDLQLSLGDELIFLPSGDEPALQILSQGFDVLIIPEGGSPELMIDKQSLAQDADLASLLYEIQLSVANAVDAKMHFIPYAFGAVPVTSTSDIISHGTHGLFGTIDVLPTDYTLSSRHGHCLEGDDCVVKIVDGAREIQFVEAGFQPSDIGLSACYETKNDPFGDGTDTKTIREFVLFFQDGLNLWDDGSSIVWRNAKDNSIVRDANNENIRIVPECEICDDSYDRGEQGVNYHSVPYFAALREADNVVPWNGSIEASDNLNRYRFPPNFHQNAENAIRLVAYEGEEIVVRVIHPGGRARQQAFVMNGYSYHDLFPGFGFPRGALLAPGKSISAWLTPDAKQGEYLWFNGPAQLRAGGIWGLLDVRPVSERQEACGL